MVKRTHFSKSFSLNAKTLAQLKSLGDLYKEPLSSVVARLIMERYAIENIGVPPHEKEAIKQRAVHRLESGLLGEAERIGVADK